MSERLRSAEEVVDAVLNMVDPKATVEKSVNELRNDAIVKALDHRLRFIGEPVEHQEGPRTALDSETKPYEALAPPKETPPDD